MPGTNQRPFCCRTARTFVLLLVLLSPVSAERLPVKSYTTADGLAHNSVNRVVRDSRGFLWFCTLEGLSRFDGYGFTNYGIEQGLPSALVNSLLETSNGQYWVATGGGLCHFNPQGRPTSVASSPSPTAQNNGQQTSDNGRRTTDNPMFTVYFPGEDARSKHILSLIEDRAGVVWCGTRNGLYRLEEAIGGVKLEFVDLGIIDRFEDRYIEDLLEDRLGSLWVGTRNGLYRRWPDGRIEAYNTRDGLPYRTILSLLEDREGRIWAGSPTLSRLVADPTPGRNVVARTYTGVHQLYQATDGSLWAGGNDGLIQFIPTADGDFKFRAYAEPHGLVSKWVTSLVEDRNRNLWVGTAHGGVAKIARNGFTTFDKADGFSFSTSIFETRAGELFVAGNPGDGGWFINRFDGDKFVANTPRFPEVIQKHGNGWGWNQTAIEDHAGEWWIATFVGLCRFPKVSKSQQLAHTPPHAIYTTRDGLATI